MRILTFNHHESYIFSLAETGHTFDVVVKKGRLNLAWDKRSRPVPSNVHLVDYDARVRERLMNGEYDLVLCHTLKNLLWLFWVRHVPFIFVAHIPLFFTDWRLTLKSYTKKAALLAFGLSHDLTFLGVSEFKRNAWRVRGRVIVLAPTDFGMVNYDLPPRCIVVCNQLLSRSEELGLSLLHAVMREVPVTIIGKNPGVDSGITPPSKDAFVDELKKSSIYLFTIRYPHGDGYNTAMLEAMNMGMAIVTVDNPSSPIIHGVNGLVGRSAAELVAHIRTLQDDPQLLRRLGSAARATVDERFSQQRFVADWQATFLEVQSKTKLREAAAPSRPT